MKNIALHVSNWFYAAPTNVLLVLFIGESATASVALVGLIASVNEHGFDIVIAHPFLCFALAATVIVGYGLGFIVSGPLYKRFADWHSKHS